MPAASFKQMHSSVRRRKKIINSDSRTPLITEKELLTTIPSSISYSTQSHYDFFNHGKSRFPSKVFHWENFIEMVKNHSIDNILKKYEKPNIPLAHAPISTKEELNQVIELQIVRALTSKLNHDDLELSKSTNNSLIDWNVLNESDQIIASVASRTHRVLRTNNDHDVIDAYQHNTGDFADNINEVYDYMCELGLKYSVLTTYEFNWFIKRSEDDSSILLISKCQKSDSNNPTILQSWNYLLYLSKNESLLTPYPIIPSNIITTTITTTTTNTNTSSNTDYFIDYSYERFPYSTSASSSIETFNIPSTSSINYGKRPITSTNDDDDDSDFKKFRHDDDNLSYITVDFLNWNNLKLKNEIINDIYLAEYDGHHLALKFTEVNDKKRFDLEKEARIYKRLSVIQGVYIPRLKYNGITLKGEKYVLATDHIIQTSRLSRIHKEAALTTIKAIHSLGIIQNDIQESNFIVGRNHNNDNVNDERVFIIDFRLSKDFKEEQRVQLSSYHIYMEKEKEKVEELFNLLPN
ncbi:hypothetical protein RhiirA5_464355 [Rhizophagus irregularis]|uniref:Protein kinase domain-containing protein n=1 Tax=Rhizophagus irregularis TaxID=588596 RepID=A0A2N0QDB6_9GLOM|nr:hypothetical protein RhiirA5_464355 [Rhizophagus irregularis]